jgi:predicted DCC family thiol-disulfide oxidoreductase YuxK
MNIILFDGICNLCDASVRFIIKRDKKSYFSFVSQQSEEGKALIKKHRLEEKDSIFYLSQAKVYSESTAIIEIVKHLDGAWKILAIFRFVPLRIRDFIYRGIAKWRYKIFGKKEICHF